MKRFAQLIVESTMDLTLRPQQGDRAKVIARAFRELAGSLLAYELDDLSMALVIDVSDIYDLADELEALE